MGEQGDIESNSLTIAPATMDIRCLLLTDTPGKDHIEVVAVDGDGSVLWRGSVPFFVLSARPNMDVSLALW